MFDALAMLRALARPDRCLRAAPAGAWALALLLAPGAWAQDTTALSFDAARTRLLEHSDQLAASRAGEQAAQLQTQALRHLGGPSVALTGMAYAYNANLGLDLDPLNQSLGQINAALPNWAQNLVGRVPIPQLPGSYTLNRHSSGTQAAVAAVWPLYTGGATEAARGLFAARQREAEAASRRGLAARRATLSAREEEVMALMLTGSMNKQIAAALEISMRTVEVHRGRVLAKMGVRNAVELAAMLSADEGTR